MRSPFFFLATDPPPMTAAYTTPTTELEAVNAMLAAVGESPITTLASALPSVETAKNLLAQTTREILRKGWRFNTESGYKVAPVAQTTQDSTFLNVFVPPAALADWKTTKNYQMAGVDVCLRKPRLYTEVPWVFFDRAKGRDGFVLPFLYIDPVWLFAFEECPDVARWYATVRASRKFAQQTIGSSELGTFAYQDEVDALRALMQSPEGRNDKVNLLASWQQQGILGFRGR